MIDVIKLGLDGAADKIYQHFKSGRHTLYKEEEHCKMLIKVMLDPDRGTYGSFCVEAMVADATFYQWVNVHPLFRNLYYFCKLIARELWEKEGRRIRDTEYPMGTINYAFEHWKLLGWSRFGISKNARIKLALNPEDTPAQHYAAILKQAAEGDFTAAEFKQLMEAVNVGLNVHQVFELQKQIDELKSDLSTLTVNSNVQNPFTNKGIEKKD
jgi:hypothetical protein